MSRIISIIGVLAAAAALAAPGAAARFIPGVTDVPSRAAEIVALRDAASLYTPQALHALGERGKAMARVYGEGTYIAGVTDVPSRSAEILALREARADASAAGQSGFEPNGTVLGALAIGAVSLLAAAGIVLRRRSRLAQS
jgi:hypothetical protein